MYDQGNLNDSTVLLVMIDLLAPCYCLLSLTAIASQYLPFLATLASHGKTWKMSSQWWWIPKRYFAHFYMIGLLSFLTIYLVLDNSNPMSSAQSLAVVHLLRRFGECCLVHRSRSTSRMHLAGYFLGIGHYILLPFVFARRPIGKSSWLAVVLTVFNLWMQFEQCQHHVLLAQLRVVNGPSYSLPPAKRWFFFILCPHYLAEILIYFSWALLLQLQGDVARNGGHQTDTPWNDFLHITTKHRHWLLFLWVATNLSISSRKNYVWYKSRSKNLTQAALIPYIF